MDCRLVDLQAEVRIKQEIFDGRYGKPSGEAIFVKYAEDVFLPWSRENKRSYVNDEYHVETFKDYFGNKSFREITPMLLERFKPDRRHGETRYKRERRPASVNRELQLLSKIFNLAIRDGLTDTNPCRNVMKLREDNQRNRYLLPDEEKRLLAQLEGPRAHLKPIVLLAIHTGMRRGEILKLRWTEVDFVRNLVYVTSTKSGKDRTVPLNDVARTVL
jgi:integrase